MLRPLDQISIKPDRVRKLFDGKAIHELANDILSIGLLHPIVVDSAGFILAGNGLGMAGGFAGNSSPAARNLRII